MVSTKLRITECPRDAMQGLTGFIPTQKKIDYLNQLLKVGFDTIDFGSFVSAKAIPQLQDTADVIKELNINESKSKLLAIVANTRGAQDASAFDAITYLGFPLSISETFQRRNTNKSIDEAMQSLQEIKRICVDSNKKLVTYISMGFGNPYGDAFGLSLVKDFVDRLMQIGSDIVSLADTIGVSSPESINSLFTSLTKQFPTTDIGVHLHSNPITAKEKIEAAYNAGCKRFDGALKGFGGCPMADDELVGNLATEAIIEYIESQQVDLALNKMELQKAMLMADEIFPIH